jgi:FkbM family methyltransferase
MRKKIMEKLNRIPGFQRLKKEIYYLVGRRTGDGFFYLQKIKSGDLVIDCGANVGSISAIMADRGAEVYAFEPNPVAFEELRKKFTGNHKVHCSNKGVFDENTTRPLYFHEAAEEDPVKWSVGSSLMVTKQNINKEKFVLAEFVDLAEFILGLGQKVKIVKMDIEGAECQVINSLIDKGVMKKIGWLLVETHAEKIPGLQQELTALKEKIKIKKINNIDFNWQ